MQYQGFSVLELLCVMALGAITCLFAVPNFYSFVYKQQANLTMQQTELAINYARSLAVRDRGRVIVCPNENRRCGSNWENGILVLSPFGQSTTFKVYVPLQNQFSLAQSGFHKQKIIIEANGLTNNNGSFIYKSRKLNVLPRFKLYFNKGLRVYWGRLD